MKNSTMTLEQWAGLKKRLKAEASRLDELATLNSLDASTHILADINTYEAGMNHQVPEHWQAMFNQMLAERDDPEYQTYLRLKRKFEGA